MAGPKPFLQTLNELRFGELHEELTTELNRLIAACAETGRAGSLTLKLNLKPGKGGQIEVLDDIKATMPKQERGSSIMFVTPENNLQRNDPRQREIEGLRSVGSSSTAELRTVNSAS